MEVIGALETAPRGVEVKAASRIWLASALRGEIEATLVP